MNEKGPMNQLLNTFPLFRELEKELLDDILTYCDYIKKEKNQYLFMQGDFMHSIYFLCNGKVKVYKIDGKGRELIVGIHTEGEMFPQDNFFVEKNHYLANAFVLEDVTLISISITHFEQLLEKYPRMSVALLKMTGKQIIDLQLRLEDKIFNTAEEQVINLLLRLSRNHAVTLSNDKILFLTPFQVKDLASMIGFSRETVSRIMNKFVLKKLIEKDDKGRLILNPVLIKDFYQ
ncbi:Crp/Fnr family transcriptional regulator [Peribacillus loiseleuriae]|nr:Crp/Fnr family transcriptional regulator [Peribacillus loiseleuriae]